MTHPVWADADAYEAYVGRWSRLVAVDFVRGLAVAPGRHWLDVGCGTGALTSTVLAEADPARITGIDPSAGFIAQARARVQDARASFHVGDARALPVPNRAVDVVVSGLTLNFVPEPALAVAEFARVVRPAGAVSAYVWDYTEGMAMMRHFWAAVAQLDPAAAGRDWRPFLGGQGSAPSYVTSLGESQRAALRDLLAARLPIGSDGSIRLTARAWAVVGTAP